jgi:Mg/Co/Ni transporter MgtE
VKVSEKFTVQDTINWIRLIADEIQDFYLYTSPKRTTASSGRYLSAGSCSPPGTSVRNIMEPVEHEATPYMDQEEVAKIFQKYGILSLGR